VPDVEQRVAPAPVRPRLDPVRERQLEEAWASLLGRTDAIADALTLTLLANEPAYARGGSQMRIELRASCRSHLDRGVRTMAGLAEPGEEAVHVWRETGRRRARQGIPMEVVLRAYSLGSRAVWEGLLERGRRGTVHIDEEMLVVAGQQVWCALDVQTATLVESYRREHARLTLRDLQRQHSLLDGLVDGRGAEPWFAREACESLGLPPDEPLACVVAAIDDPRAEPLHGPDDRLARAGIVSHWHVRAGHYFGVVALGRRPVGDLVALLQPCVRGRVGLALVPDGTAGFEQAYRIAARAADTLPDGCHRLTTLEDRLPELLLADSPDIVPSLVHESLGPLLTLPEHQSALLLDTLAVLLAHDGSPTHAAGELYCHRNTVIYRMRRIEELTGRRLGNPRDKLLLSLGVLATGRTF
jgi:PucR C-terminal helix-turn-helix domain